MKNTFAVFILFAMLAAFISCTKENNQPPAGNKNLLLSKVFFADSGGKNKELAIEVFYDDKNNINEVKQLNGDGSISLLINNFLFDDKNRITGFTTGSGSFSSFIDSKIFYADDKVSLVQVFTRTGSSSVLDHTVFLSYNGNTVISTGFAADGVQAEQTTATYNSAGNIEKIEKLLQGGSGVDITQFFSYDGHPNPLDKLIEEVGGNGFLPASKNNPGVTVQTFDPGNTNTQEVIYEYNTQGLPVVKTVNDAFLQQTIFEYTEAK